MNNARLEDAVEFKSRASAEFDVGDQPFSFRHIDSQQAGRSNCCNHFRRRRLRRSRRWIWRRSLVISSDCPGRG